MRSILNDAVYKVGKADALLYAFEQAFLDIEPGPDDYEKVEKGTYVFYEIWEAVKETNALLNKLCQERMVIDAIEAATKCENCSLKKKQ